MSRREDTGRRWQDSLSALALCSTFVSKKREALMSGNYSNAKLMSKYLLRHDMWKALCLTCILLAESVNHRQKHTGDWKARARVVSAREGCRTRTHSQAHAITSMCLSVSSAVLFIFINKRSVDISRKSLALHSCVARKLCATRSELILPFTHLIDDHLSDESG